MGEVGFPGCSEREEGVPPAALGSHGPGCVWMAHALALPMSPALRAASKVACLVSESPT